MISSWAALVVAAVAVVAAATAAEPACPAAQFHEALVEGWQAGPGAPDPRDPVAVFRHIFAQLPAVVDVHPGENYYYWQLPLAGRELRGNLALPAVRRGGGLLSIGYAEFEEFPGPPGARRVEGRRFLGVAEGAEVTAPDPFTRRVRAAGREVVFRLQRIPQHPPRGFRMLERERFVARTCDESGLRFLLLFDTRQAGFLWVLDEETPPAEHFTPLAADVVAGNRTGFVFWLDPAAPPRKVLAAVRRASVARNDYYDGPFDQLPDNHIATGEVELRRFIELALPAVQGRIDEFGYFTDTAEPARVALSNYGTYGSFAEALGFVAAAIASGDPHRAISRGDAAAPAPGPAAGGPVAADPAAPAGQSDKTAVPQSPP